MEKRNKMEEFLKFVAEIMEVNVKELSAETEYQSISQWDSLMHLRLVAEIEEKYEIEIPIEQVPDIKTLYNFYEYVFKEKVVNK